MVKMVLSIGTYNPEFQYKGLVTVTELTDDLFEDTESFFFKMHIGEVPNIHKIELQKHDYLISFLCEKTAKVLKQLMFTGCIYIPEYKVDDNHYITVRAVETKPIKLRGEK